MNYSGGLGIGVIQEDSQGARERTKKIWDKALREGSSTYTIGKVGHGNGVGLGSMRQHGTAMAGSQISSLRALSAGKGQVPSRVA